MMEKRAPRMMDTHSLFGHESTFDKMAAHVKSLGGRSGDVSTKQPAFPKVEPTKPYQRPDFSFMDKGKK